MPTYVYRCSMCNVIWETNHSIHDDQPEFHGECGMEASRVPQAVGLAFKGAGWAGKPEGQV